MRSAYSTSGKLADQPSLASCNIHAPPIALFLNCYAQQAGQLNRLKGGNDRALKLLDPHLHAGDGRATQVGTLELGVTQIGLAQVAIAKDHVREIAAVERCLAQHAVIEARRLE